MKIIGQYRVPFAIKGGGHTLNPGFSSTVGVLISMSRFQKVVYHRHKLTADLGAGLIWDDAYAALEPYDVTVVGGRIAGVGVAGLLLGGGYSWKSNQYGLSIDTISGYEVSSEIVMSRLFTTCANDGISVLARHSFRRNH